MKNENEIKITKTTINELMDWFVGGMNDEKNYVSVPISVVNKKHSPILQHNDWNKLEREKMLEDFIPMFLKNTNTEIEVVSYNDVYNNKQPNTRFMLEGYRFSFQTDSLYPTF